MLPSRKLRRIISWTTLVALVSIQMLLFGASQTANISDTIFNAPWWSISFSFQSNNYCLGFERSEERDDFPQGLHIDGLNMLDDEEMELPPCFSRQQQHNGTSEYNDTTIRIATVLDQNYFDPIFPSWINALSKSNGKAVLELYILTVDLTPKQRCILRTVVSLWLPHASVYTIPFKTEEFKASYSNKGAHISVATQARLRLSSLLPCIDKIAWIDLDAFVLKSLQGFWSYSIPSCGITARLDGVKYLNTIGPLPNNISWHDSYGYSFNAGVVLLSLETLRKSRFEETIVQYWAIELGYNDQVVLNMACNGTHGILNETMNMLQTSDLSKIPIKHKNWVTHLYYPSPEEWVIFHFTSSQKPWSSKPFKRKAFNSVWFRHRITMKQALRRAKASLVVRRRGR